MEGIYTTVLKKEIGDSPDQKLARGSWAESASSPDIKYSSRKSMLKPPTPMKSPITIELDRKSSPTPSAKSNRRSKKERKGASTSAIGNASAKS